MQEAAALLIATTVERRKWPTLVVLSLAELLAMSVWFSASAVVPALTTAWSLDESGRAWLTMSVQIGFVVGALGSALLNLADRIPSRRLFTIAALLAGAATALIPLVARGVVPALVLRFLTGMVLAGVYPVGMKIMATWAKADRGLGIGLLVGALTIGSASPHLLNAFGGIQNWQFVLYLAGGSAALGGLVNAALVEEGPYRTPAPRFDWRQAGAILRDRPTMLANTGYLGHMWELFAMWSWIAIFFLDSFAQRGIAPETASLAAFAVIAAGGPGSLLAGKLADKVGRTTITIASMVISGLCSLLIGFLFRGNPLLLVGVAVVWGFTIVADSAQFSACVSELCDPKLTGTALTLQTSMGFLLTLITIRLVPTLVRWVGWEWAFAFLAIGPVVGIWGMLVLRRSPEASKLAGGNR